jgi:carbon storage regulator CsrA
MLVLTRKTDERITIGDKVDVVVLSIRGNRVRLGISAPTGTAISRLPADTPTDRTKQEQSVAVCCAR